MSIANKEYKISYDDIQQMDQDLAIQVIMSAISFSSKKTIMTFGLACKLMAMREKEKENDSVFQQIDTKYFDYKV